MYPTYSSDQSGQENASSEREVPMSASLGGAPGLIVQSYVHLQSWAPGGYNHVVGLPPPPPYYENSPHGYSGGDDYHHHLPENPNFTSLLQTAYNPDFLDNYRGMPSSGSHTGGMCDLHILLTLMLQYPVYFLYHNTYFYNRTK